MAEISRLSRLLSGVQRGVDLTSNTLVVQDLKVGGTGGSGSLLTKTILDRLISLQNGSNVDATYHVHNDTTIPYTRLDGSKKDIQAASDDVGAAINDLDDDKISKTGSIAFTGDQSLGSHKLTNVSDPGSAQDAATKAYVDGLLDGRSWKQPVRVASTANIDLSVAADPSPVDGVTLADGDRILLKNQTAGAENGIYVAVTAIDPTTWTRATDANTALELEGAAVYVEEGTVNKTYQYAQTAASITLGTTALVWVVTSANSFSGHDMITLTGGQISVDLAAASGLESTNAGNAAGQLRIKLEASNPTLKFTGSNELAAKLNAAGAIASGASGLAVQVDSSTIEINTNALRVKDAGITLAKLASNSVDENKIVSTAFNAAGAITGGSGSKLAVQVDGSTIEISANALRVKDAGITTAKIAANAVDDTLIRLRNAQYLRARNNAGSGDVNILRVNTSDVIEFASLPQAAGTPSSGNDLVNKTYADSLSSGVISESVVAGESFAANTTFAVRWAITGETAGRIYKADDDATTTDKFHVVGMLKVGSALSAGDPCTLTKFGTLSQASGDSAFASGDVGKPVFLTSSGAWSITPSSTANHANVIIGYVKTTTVMDVKSLQIQGVN